MLSINFHDYKTTLEQKYKELQEKKEHITGYPSNQNFDYSVLTKFLNLH